MLRALSIENALGTLKQLDYHSDFLTQRQATSITRDKKKPCSSESSLSLASQEAFGV
jgi:hypothetical protein